MSSFDRGVRKGDITSTSDQEQGMKACVKKQGNKKCKIYQCKVLGTPLAVPNTESKTQPPSFGFAGKFVQREDNVRRAVMEVRGDARWDSGCIVSHKYKFVYTHVLKSGGSALKTFIRQSFCGEDDPECAKADRQIISPVACSAAVNKYPDYFFWSFVRNPFSRMYSMYSMMEGFPVPGKPFSDYSFDEFVLNSRKERKLHTSMSASHYEPQARFLFDQYDCPSFDFLGRLEHFDDDMNVLLTHLKVPEMDAQMKLQGGTMRQENTWGTNGKKARLGGDLRNAYRAQEIVDHAANEFSRDFRLLGFDKSMNAVPIN